jgi:hypothetical protein
MSKFKFYFIVLCSAFVLFSCNKSDDDILGEQLRYYGPQYATERKIIESYLQTHYIEEIVNNPGQIDDQDIKISLIPNNNTTLQSLWDSPLLDSVPVDFNGITYTVYYLKLREGTSVNPSRVDQVLTGYDGSYLSWEKVTVVLRNPDGTPQLFPNGSQKTEEQSLTVPYRFEYVQHPQALMPLDQLIQGWREIMPFFKSGSVIAQSGSEPAMYNDFGAGVMFVPSALAYYNRRMEVPTGSEILTAIPAYSPLMFKFKLYDVKKADHDGDGILSNDEDLNHDGLFTNDDTDGDGVQNYRDGDDDGDGYLTRAETKFTYSTAENPSEILVGYYPFNGAVTDDPLTPYDDRLGVPNCSDDFTNPERVRKYLDRTCH